MSEVTFEAGLVHSSSPSCLHICSWAPRQTAASAALRWHDSRSATTEVAHMGGAKHEHSAQPQQLTQTSVRMWLRFRLEMGGDSKTEGIENEPGWQFTTTDHDSFTTQANVFAMA